MKYKVAIADDHELFRIGLKTALASFKDLDIVINVNNGTELIKELSTKKVDVILLDLKMPNKSGYETLKEIRLFDEKVIVLVLSMFSDEEYIALMMESQANGYLLKDVNAEEIYKAITSAVNTGYYFNNTINQLLLSNKLKLKARNSDAIKAPGNITEPELKLIKLLIEGKLMEDIAKELDLSLRMIESIKQKLQKKLGVKNTLGIVLYAYKHKLHEI